MPYKTEKLRMPRELDRRVKLTDLEREQIKADHAAGTSQRAIARAYKVSRSLIRFILFPEKLEENKLRHEERGGWKQYYDAAKHREAIRDHRRYKHSVLKHKTP